MRNYSWDFATPLLYFDAIFRQKRASLSLRKIGKRRTRLVYFDAIEKNAISSRAFPASGQFTDVEGREGHVWGSQNEAKIDAFPSHQ